LRFIFSLLASEAGGGASDPALNSRAAQSASSRSAQTGPAFLLGLAITAFAPCHLVCVAFSLAPFMRSRGLARKAVATVKTMLATCVEMYGRYSQCGPPKTLIRVFPDPAFPFHQWALQTMREWPAFPTALAPPNFSEIP
jgi:hypothetical protein